MIKKPSNKKQLLYMLNEALSKYLEVHDALFNQKLFQKVDYGNLLSKLENSKEEIESLEREAKDLFEEDHILFEYLTSLEKAQIKLLQIVENLEKKSEGKKYGMLEYRRDLKEYEKLQENYTQLGERLNRLV